MNVFIYFILVFLLFQNSNYSKCCCCTKNKDFNNNDKNDDKKKKDDNKENNNEDQEINYELENIELKDLTTEKLKEVKDYYKNKCDIDKLENEKKFEEDHNWINNYKFNYSDNKNNVPGYIQWTGVTCSMCAALNALYGLKYFRDFFKKDKLEDNLDNYLKILSRSLDKDVIPYFYDFYNIFNINLFDFLKRVFNDFDNKKIIVSNKEIHTKYVRLIEKSSAREEKLEEKVKEEFYKNLISKIFTCFTELNLGLKIENEFDRLFEMLNLSNFKSKDLKSIIIEYINKEYINKEIKLSEIKNILYFTIEKKQNDKIVENINLFKEVKFNDIINIEEIIDCSEFLEKNKDLKGKLNYKLKSIIIHCGPASTGGDYGCFRKDDNEDKYWYFQMNEKPEKYTLEDIINKTDFAGYKTINTLSLYYELYHN